MPRVCSILLVVLIAACGGTTPVSSPAPSVGAREIDLGAIPSSTVVFDFGSVWVGASDKGDVERVDPNSGSIVTRIKVGDPAKQSSRARTFHGVPVAIASGLGAIWATGADETLSRIDPKTLDIAQYPIGIVGSAIAVSDDAVWVASFDDGALVRFDPATKSVLKTIRGQGALQGIATAAGSVWAVNRSGHELLRFDAGTGEVVARIPVARNPQSVAVGLGAVWVTRETPRAVLRIDPATNMVTGTYAAEDTWGVGAGLAFADDGIWLGNVARIDPATGKVLAYLTTAGAAEQLAIAVGGGSVWIVGATNLRQVPLSLVK